MFGEGAFEDGARVYVAAGFDRREGFLDEFFELLEVLFDDFVVVAAVGVTGDASGIFGKFRLGAVVVFR